MVYLLFVTWWLEITFSTKHYLKSTSFKSVLLVIQFSSTFTCISINCVFYFLLRIKHCQFNPLSFVASALSTTVSKAHLYEVFHCFVCFLIFTQIHMHASVDYILDSKHCHGLTCDLWLVSVDFRILFACERQMLLLLSFFFFFSSKRITLWWEL